MYLHTNQAHCYSIKVLQLSFRHLGVFAFILLDALVFASLPFFLLHTYIALNSSHSEIGLPVSTSMPPFPDISTLLITCCSLTRESCSAAHRRPTNVMCSGEKKTFDRRQWGPTLDADRQVNTWFPFKQP